MILGALLLQPSPVGAQDAAPAGGEEQPADPEAAVRTDEDRAPADLAPVTQQAAEGDEEREDEEPGEEEQADESPDALHDPVISKVLKRRLLIDRPRFSVETGGKVQVQFYDADSADPENEDELFLRRLRPFFLGHIARNWTWKAEIELGADIEAGDIDLNQLDIRDLFLRYEGFRSESWRLTIGNQKTPFSRDFLTPSIHQLLVERTFVGDTSGGVPDRVLGVHFRGATPEGKLAYWGGIGAAGHDPDVNRLKFDSLVGGSGNLNEGLLLGSRLDFHPRGPMTFNDGDPHTPELKYTWSLAGYVWENDGSKNRFTEGGVAIDPERADLDSANGVELSGGLRGRGITLDWQYNHIRGRTVVEDFTGGIYVDGDTTLDVAAMEGGYWIRNSPVELGGALSRIDTDGYVEASDTVTLALNLHLQKKFRSKLQISHSWTSSRNGVPGEDVQETRIQLQYVW